MAESKPDQRPFVGSHQLEVHPIGTREEPDLPAGPGDPDPLFPAVRDTPSDVQTRPLQGREDLGRVRYRPPSPSPRTLRVKRT